MILVKKYYGTLGNNLFQYIFPRIIAHQLGYRFSAPPLLKLPTEISGKDYRNPVQLVSDPALTGQKGQVSMGEVLIGHPRMMIFQGYFQQADKYVPWRELIREWLRPSILKVRHPEGTVGVSIRLGDYVRLGHKLPLEYYRRAMDEAVAIEKPTTCVVYSDASDFDLGDHVYLLTKYCKVLMCNHLGPEAQFASLTGCPYIIGANSTFSWWASFLSNAKGIWMPHNTSPWRGSPEIDLRVYEPEWHIVDMEVK